MAVKSQGENIEQVERNIVANGTRARERFKKVETRINNNELLTRLELGGTPNEGSACGRRHRRVRLRHRLLASGYHPM